ncbi:MAG: L-seryl-tRNA(Sec) selenium transferase [Acidobacteriia bacterium]|nr:L-seryl-tRNA(Sec) selenium transferase [Terriglobia bacterium]
MPQSTPAVRRPKHAKRNSNAPEELLRQIPAVDQILRQTAWVQLLERFPHGAVVEVLRSQLTRMRQQARLGKLDREAFGRALEALPESTRLLLEKQFLPSLKKVINATGVILHTNLGRAPLGKAALERIHEVATSYSNLEFDLERNERGRRDVHAARLLTRLLPAEAALVVNNNAAAVWLALNSLAEGGEVIVSRGELVEIGGSFRIPEIMRKSGAVLREVGTTNRTRVSDYARAINKNTRLILRVHRSNFRVVGFTEQPPLQELVRLAHKKKLRVLEDLGSGCLVDLKSSGLSEEPTVEESLKAGVDVVTFSGDKLLGGPQSGIILGRRKLIEPLRANPIYRALRVDKLTLAALEATLLAYLRKDERETLPILKMIFAPANEIRLRSERFVEKAQNALPYNSGISFQIIEGKSVMGGGSTPGESLPTFLISVRAASYSAGNLEKHFRTQLIPILVRVEHNQVLIDLRTVFPTEEDHLLNHLVLLLNS